MDEALGLFDIVLIGGLLGLAWGTLTSSHLYRAVVLFIAFGLCLALAWARLRAPDVALAEAAIGAGLSGALLLAAVRKADTELKRPKHSSRNKPTR